LARNNEIELLISEAILAEVSDVLKKKFGWTDEQISFTLDELRSITSLIIPDTRLKVIKNDETDNRFLECALAGGAKYLVTGDTRHLQPLKEFNGIQILSPADFLAVLSTIS